MRLALAGSVGRPKVAAGGGVSAPSTPTLTEVGDAGGGSGQSAYVLFTCPNLNGGTLTAVELRWSTSSGMTSPTTLTTGNSTWSTNPGGVLTALASIVQGTAYDAFTDVGFTGTRPTDGTNAWYQLRLTNSAGASSWSTAYGPVATSLGS